MKPAAFALIGAGYRAAYFARIARALPEHFRVTSVLARGGERSAAFARRFGLHENSSLDELLAEKPDFVVLSVSRGALHPLLMDLLKQGIPVLCETPPGETTEELAELWALARSTGARVQVAEQYFLQPLYAAWYEAIRLGLIGPVQNISLSALHGYHGVSIIRRFLGAGMAPCAIHGKRYGFSAVKTSSREGLCFDGSVTDYGRDRLELVFDTGQAAFYDFAGIQYHSFIRTRQLNVQGLRGEIDDLVIRRLNSDNQPLEESLHRVDLGIYNGREFAHEAIMLGERQLYRSPFPNARLNDDELALASCLSGMQAYLREGKPFYPLEEALQDSYLSLLMDQALENPLSVVRSKAMPWH